MSTPVEKMTPKRLATRNRILDVAEQLVLTGSFHSMSVDKLIDEVGISKGTFFYHFANKEALAKALIVRFVDRRAEMVASLHQEMSARYEDPLDVLIAMLESMAIWTPGEGMPRGCLVGSYAYHLMEEMPEVQITGSAAMKGLEGMLLEGLEAVAAQHKPVHKVNLQHVAEMLPTILQGSLVIGRVHKDMDVYNRQIAQFVDYLRLLFGRE